MRNPHTTALAIAIITILCGTTSLHATTTTLQAKTTSSLNLRITSHINALNPDPHTTAPKPSLADYISRQLRESGTQVGGTANSYYQPIQIPTDATWDPQENTLRSLTMSGQRTPFQPRRDFQPLGFSATASGAAEIVVAGYGLTIPGPETLQYDSYKDLDLNGKAVLILDGILPPTDTDKHITWHPYADLHYKATQARDRGAAAILVVIAGNTLIPTQTHAHAGDLGIPAFTITPATANKLLTTAGTTIQDAIQKINTNPATPGYIIPGLRLEYGASIQRTQSTRRNILATIPPQNGATDYILLSTRYGPDATTQTAITLEIARTLANDLPTTTAPRRGIIIAFWHDTPTGTTAAHAWTQNPTIPLQHITACINLQPTSPADTLLLQGTGSSFTWNTLLTDATETTTLQVTTQETPHLPTDVTPFYTQNIPILNIHTHMQNEDILTGWADISALTQLHDITIALLTGPLTNPDTPINHIQVEHTGTIEARDGVRVSLGTAPDYDTPVTGVKLAGIRPGSPAQKAGLKPGDTITSLAGKPIVNIYDYTYTLDTLQPGHPIPITITRNNTTQTLTITPEPR